MRDAPTAGCASNRNNPDARRRLRHGARVCRTIGRANSALLRPAVAQPAPPTPDARANHETWARCARRLTREKESWQDRPIRSYEIRRTTRARDDWDRLAEPDHGGGLRAADHPAGEYR